MNKNFFKIFESFNSFAVGFFSCYLLRSQFDLNAVLASALIGLIGSFVPQSKLYNYQNVRAAIYAGSFAGMSSIRVLDSINDFILVAVFGALALTALDRKFLGVGGKLGTIAFIATSFLILYRNMV